MSLAHEFLLPSCRRTGLAERSIEPIETSTVQNAYRETQEASCRGLPDFTLHPA